MSDQEIIAACKKYYSSNSYYSISLTALTTDIKCIERRLQEGTAFGDVVAQNIVCSLQAFGYIANRYKGKKVFDTVIAALKQIIKEKVKLTDQQTTWMTKLSFAEFYESIAELFKLQLDAGYPLNVTDLDKYISMTNQYITEVSFSHQVMETPEAEAVYDKLLGLACRHTNHFAIKYFMSMKMMPSDADILTLVNKNTNNKNTEIIKECINLGYQPKPDMITNIVSLYPIDTELLTFVLKTKPSIPKNVITSILKHVYVYSARKGHAHKDAATIAKIIDLLCGSGYKLTEDDVINLLSKRCYVNNIEEKHKVTSKIYGKSITIGYYPYKKPDSFDGIGILYMMLEGTTTIKKIKDAIALHDIKPDIKCLELAFKKANDTLAKFFISEYKLKPNMTCLKNALTSSSQNKSLILIKKYIDDIVEEKRPRSPVAQKTGSIEEKDAAKATEEKPSEKKPVEKQPRTSTI